MQDMTVCVAVLENVSVCTHPDLLLSDGVVCVVGEELHGEGPTLPQFGRQQETHCTEELQLRSLYHTGTEEPVEEVGGHGKDLLLTRLLLAHLWMPREDTSVKGRGGGLPPNVLTYNTILLCFPLAGVLLQAFYIVPQ